MSCTFEELLLIDYAFELVAGFEDDLASDVLDDDQRAELAEIKALLAAIPPLSIDDQLDCVKTALINMGHP
tara:strand:- start:410 stop:622 length:213 start_codon:yes stop_codon:yes gene_type:complete